MLGCLRVLRVEAATHVLCRRTRWPSFLPFSENADGCLVWGGRGTPLLQQMHVPGRREEAGAGGLGCPVGQTQEKGFFPESLRKARIRTLKPPKRQEPVRVFKLQIGLSAGARTKGTGWLWTSCCTRSPISPGLGARARVQGRVLRGVEVGTGSVV